VGLRASRSLALFYTELCKIALDYEMIPTKDSKVMESVILLYFQSEIAKVGA
jgi:hypothetical protein